MENTKKRVGRPKAEPPKGPLVLEGIQKRETILTEVSVDVAEELGDYAAWVKESAPAKMTAAEATSKTVDTRSGTRSGAICAGRRRRRGVAERKTRGAIRSRRPPRSVRDRPHHPPPYRLRSLGTRGRRRNS